MTNAKMPHESSTDLKALDAEKILATCRHLEVRIRERFPQASLARVAQELVRAAERMREGQLRVQQPNLALRAGIGVVMILVVGVIQKVASYVHLSDQVFNLPDFIQTSQATLETMFFLGAGAIFFFSLESRIKRERALEYIHELRSLAHIVDMHQLTKDPEILIFNGPATPSSPVRSMTPFELSRYFDYCTELLSLISKIAAFYVQKHKDPVVLTAVDQIEDLTTGLSQKIWQKTSILDRLSGANRQ